MHGCLSQEMYFSSHIKVSHSKSTAQCKHGKTSGSIVKHREARKGFDECSSCWPCFPQHCARVESAQRCCLALISVLDQPSVCPAVQHRSTFVTDSVLQRVRFLFPSSSRDASTVLCELGLPSLCVRFLLINQSLVFYFL